MLRGGAFVFFVFILLALLYLYSLYFFSRSTSKSIMAYIKGLFKKHESE